MFGKIPDSGKEDVDKAVASAKKCFKSWSKTTRQERSKILNKIADLIEANLQVDVHIFKDRILIFQELAELESRDQGKPVSLAKTIDIPRAALNFRFFAGAILHHEETSTEIDNVAMNYTGTHFTSIPPSLPPFGCSSCTLQIHQHHLSQYSSLYNTST